MSHHQEHPDQIAFPLDRLAGLGRLRADVARLIMAIPAGSDTQLIEEAYRVLRSLITERQLLQRRPDGVAHAEANKIAIAYWRGVIDGKLRSPAR
jgi:hypothetical protein